MRKLWLILLPLLLLGCGSKEVFEQVDDRYEILLPQAQVISLDLPEEAAVAAMSGGGNTLYFCEGYTLAVQTLPGGDLNRSLQTLTGYSKDRLTVIRTGDRYTCAFSSMGENGSQVGQVVLVDDGAYHYGVTVMADAEVAGNLTEIWEELLGSVRLSRTDP